MKKNKNLFLFWFWFTGVTLGLSYVGNRIYTNNKNYNKALEEIGEVNWEEKDSVTLKNEALKNEALINKRDSLNRIEYYNDLISLGYSPEEAQAAVSGGVQSE